MCHTAAGDAARAEARATLSPFKLQSLNGEAAAANLRIEAPAFELAAVVPGMRVLDVACGRGESVRHCAHLGAAAYGFYDEQWKPVIKDGAHGQLIEINTWGLAASDPDRFAGIYQVVGGLKTGATYQLSLWGLMREEAAHPDEDPYRYRVQWGFAPASATSVTNWTELTWNEISLRTAPGPVRTWADLQEQLAAGQPVIVEVYSNT